MVVQIDIPVGYKQTEIGIIPEDWKIKQLSNISTMHGRIGWQGLKQDEFTSNPDDPFLITGMDFKGNYIDWYSIYHIPLNRYNEAIPIQLDSNDILMTKDGTIGKTLFVDKIPYPHKASLNSHLLVFRPIKKQYNPKYLYYILNSNFFDSHIEKEKTGTTFFGLSQSATSKFMLPLPPLPEQKAIAKVLGDTDVLIESLDALISKKSAIKQGAMQELLTGKRRLPGFVKLDGYKQTEVGIIPEDWVLLKLGHIVERLSNGAAYPQSNYGRLPITRIETISDGKIDFSRTGKVFQNSELEKYKLVKGDILFSHINSIDHIGKVAYFSHKKILYHGMNLLLIRANQYIDSKYLFFLLNLKNTRSRLRNLARQAINQASINTSELRLFTIPLPPLSEQRAIKEVLTDMDTEIETLEKKRNKYKQIKQGMMEQLLTGKVRLV